MAVNAEQKRLFTEALQKQCGDEDKERSQFLTERKYEQVCAGLEEFYQAGDASEKKAVQKVHSQAVRVGKEVRARRLQRLQGPHLQGPVSRHRHPRLYTEAKFTGGEVLVICRSPFFGRGWRVKSRGCARKKLAI